MIIASFDPRTGIDEGIMRTVLMAWLLAGGLLAQRVLEVGPGQAFSSVQAAVDAAVAGDRIVVHVGTYPGARVTKGVRIVCHSGTVLGPFVFENVPAGDTASIAGAGILSQARWFASTALPAPPCVRVANCLGTVSLDRCSLSLQGVQFSNHGGPGLQVESATVIASRCTFSQSLGGPVASALQATVMLSDCGTLTSSTGSYTTGIGTFPVPASAGIQVLPATTLVLARTSAQGGPVQAGAFSSGNPGIRTSGTTLLAGPLTAQGGPGAPACCGMGGAGGAGIAFNGTLYIDQATLLGGPGSVNPPGPNGPPFAGGTPTPAALPVLSTTSLAPAGGQFRLDASARPNTWLYLAMNFATLPLTLPGVEGVLIPRLDAGLLVEGPIVVGPAGQVTRTIPIPADPGLRGVTLFAQCLGLDPAAFPLAFWSAAVQATVAP